MERGVILGAQPAPFQQGHGDRVAHGQGGRRARRRGQVHGTGLFTDADVEHDPTLPRQRGGDVPRQQHDGHVETFEERHDGEELVRLARVRQGHDDVAGRHHPEISVDALGGMQEVGGRARGGQRGRELPRDDPRLAHARHDHAAAAALQEVHGRVEARIELRHQGQDGLRFQPEDAGREAL